MKVPTWILPCLLTASLCLSGALVYHIVFQKNDIYTGAHDKALTSLVDAMSTIQLMYRDIQQMKTLGVSCESKCY